MKTKKIPLKLIIFFVFISIIPFIISVSSIYYGRIAFWFDPARDLLLALKNLEHPTLVGQPTGIPGILYPPYWIWFISGVLLISKNPQVVVSLLLTIPYFTVFPYFLYKLVGRWGIPIFGALWFLFITGFNSYSNQIWNIHLFPIFLIITIYFSIFAYVVKKNKKKTMLFFLLSGAFLGVSSTFHLSLGIPVVLSVVSFHLLFFLSSFRKGIKKIKESFINFSLFLIGLILAYTPTILFELRHNFFQTSTFMKAVTDSAFYNSAVVGQIGFSDSEILDHFICRTEILLSVKGSILFLFLFVIFLEFVFRILGKKIKLEIFEKGIVLLCLTSFAWVLFIYINNKNPVWDYYFMGIEIFSLIFLGFLAKNTILGKFLLGIAVVLALVSSFKVLSTSFQKNDLRVTDLAVEKYIVNLITDDSEGDFYYYAFNPAIYTYEYDYLFKFNAKDRLNENSDLIYLIIPKTTDAIRIDFINYRAGVKFNRISEWMVPDGTTVYKMQRN